MSVTFVTLICFILWESGAALPETILIERSGFSQ
jgi:hypothetical protein